jgi:hypothetical protein
MKPRKPIKRTALPRRTAWLPRKREKPRRKESPYNYEGKDVKSKPKYLDDDGVFRFPNQREVCQLTSSKGATEYQRRKRVMWERQNKLCALQISPQCKEKGGKLNWADTVFGHESSRGLGGGSRDDRIEIDGKPHNYALCNFCNMLQGSRNIPSADLYDITP